MTNQEINERVAKLCGWERRKHCKGYYRNDHEGYIFEPPNYAKSLDACREFEEAMNAREKVVYADLLVDLCGDDSYDPIFAPSAVRCEAFLRLKGQWE